jgi:HAD superfamily hydrolase (TIGR01509 family)
LGTEDKMTQQSTQAVIFDMDGVIVDSEPRHERAFVEVVRQIGFEGKHDLLFADYVGRSDMELWLDFLARYPLPHTLEELLEMKRVRMVEIIRREKPLFVGLPELVARLAAHYKLALASGSERMVVDEVLRLDGLARFFPITLSASDVERGKPEPDIFLRAAELLGVAPCACWVVEDSKPGVAAALAAGMKVLAITNTHSAEELAHATYVATSYEEVEKVLLAQRYGATATSR